MRTAILTDVHANLPALKAVLDRCRALAVDRYVCLGDSVGYAANPNECCELLRERVAFSLLGNHDAAVSGRMDYEYYYPAARYALDWTRQRLDAANLAWLESLPYNVREGDVEYCHGSPLEPEQYDYIFLTEQAAELLPIWGSLAELTLIGHSHLPRAYELTPNSVRGVLAEEVRIHPGRKYLVSIGSVGQPRDGDPRACFGVHDDEAKTVTFHRVEYDIDDAARRVLHAGLSSHFANRLYQGT